ncbi:hypothetical protein DCAR_0310584 [Daucus carota subsp. sativus]|uniref:Uncharacterized protein n=1 Tax=Daucus carota subsp. sativus TaxID=79200 RepID=A0A166A0B6_DAUCS|nr:hypothetical protein DCAR_0310584 [Daucus carota subsp. sativus]
MITAITFLQLFSLKSPFLPLNFQSDCSIHIFTLLQPYQTTKTIFNTHFCPYKMDNRKYGDNQMLKKTPYFIISPKYSDIKK